MHTKLLCSGRIMSKIHQTKSRLTFLYLKGENSPFISGMDWGGMDGPLNGGQLGAVLCSVNDIDFIEISHGFKNLLLFQHFGNLASQSLLFIIIQPSARTGEWR